MTAPRALAIGGLAMSGLAASGLAALGLMAFVLAACAGASPDRAPLIDRMAGPGRVQGDRDRVSVEGGRLDTLPLAVAHCARFGRSARFSQSTDGRTVYACVVQ